MNTNDYIRIQFKEHGRTREGADCWGLVRIIFKEELGIELPSIEGYKNTKDFVKISEIIESNKHNWQMIQSGQEQAFDVAVFKTIGLPTHVAVVIKPGYMIHCEKGSGVYMSEYYKEQQWHRRLEGFFRYATDSSIIATIPSS